MDILNAYVIPEVVALCLVLGFVIKQWVKDVDNKWIPTIVAVVGIGCAVVLNGFTVGAVVGGAVSGFHRSASAVQAVDGKRR